MADSELVASVEHRFQVDESKNLFQLGIEFIRIGCIVAFPGRPGKRTELTLHNSRQDVDLASCQTLGQTQFFASFHQCFRHHADQAPHFVGTCRAQICLQRVHVCIGMSQQEILEDLLLYVSGTTFRSQILADMLTAKNRVAPKYENSRLLA